MSLFGLISSAEAQTTGAATPAAGPADFLNQFMQGPGFMLVAIGVIWYFLIIRPQTQKAKQLKTQLSELRRGDNVITSGGIIGTVARVVSDDEVSLEIADGVRVRVVRSTITGITGKGEPRTDVKAESDEASKPKPVRRGKTPPASANAPASANTPASANANESTPQA